MITVPRIIDIWEPLDTTLTKPITLEPITNIVAATYSDSIVLRLEPISHMEVNKTIMRPNI